MIACGSSLRGLSEVTIATSASSEAMPAHQRTLAAVAVAARADDADDAPARELARGTQHVLERVGLVRVVDDHRERLPLLHGLEPARHAAHRLEPARDRRVVDPEQARRCERAERVLDVEAAAQLERRRRRAPPARSPQRGSKPKVSASGSSAASRRPYSSPTLTAAGGRRDEEAPFRLEVRLHVAVEVEVVLAEVREDEAAKRTRSSRCSCDACDDASIAHERSPASSISRNVRCRSIASGVVRTTPRRSPPTRASTVPSRPGRRPAAARIA